MRDTFWSGHNFVTVNGYDSGISANQVKLGQIAIPGSHDSTTYTVGDLAPICQSQNWIVENFAGGMTERWSRTQHYDLYRQATLGVRSFDLRIYYDGSSIRTCHTLDAASLDEAIRGDGGLDRFAREEPLEPMILNLSHYKAPDGEGETKWREGLDNLIGYLQANVCPRAVSPVRREKDRSTGREREIAVNPANLELKTIAEQQKNYVVLADDENGLYRYLEGHGLKECVFHTNAFMTGGYAGIRDVRVGGETVSTNLWLALVRAYAHELRDPAVKAREATQQVLIEAMEQRSADKLHETTYVWAYDEKFDDGEFAAFLIKQKYGDSLIQMTEKGVVTWNSFFVNTGEVEVGLLEHGAGFIQRLDEAARNANTNVNIVNMDAIGDTALTRDGFILPVLALNTRMVW